MHDAVTTCLIALCVQLTPLNAYACDPHQERSTQSKDQKGETAPLQHPRLRQHYLGMQACVQVAPRPRLGEFADAFMIMIHSVMHAWMHARVFAAAAAHLEHRRLCRRLRMAAV